MGGHDTHKTPIMHRFNLHGNLGQMTPDLNWSNGLDLNGDSGRGCITITVVEVRESTLMNKREIFVGKVQRSGH